MKPVMLWTSLLCVICCTIGCNDDEDPASDRSGRPPIHERLNVEEQSDGIRATSTWFMTDEANGDIAEVDATDLMRLTRGDWESVTVQLQRKNGEVVQYELNEEKAELSVVTPHGQYVVSFTPNGDLLFQGQEWKDENGLADYMNTLPGFADMHISLKGVSKEHADDIDELAASRGKVIKKIGNFFAKLFRRITVNCRFQTVGRPDCGVRF
ncbi:MAG: hypothetical protein R3F65_05125 [bacterium]